MRRFDRFPNPERTEQSGRARKAIAAALLPIVLLAACSSSEDKAESPKATNTTSTTSIPKTTTTESPVRPPVANSVPTMPGRITYDANPQHNFSVNDCANNVHTWVSHIDNDPADIEDLPPQTIGLTKSYDEQGDPVLALGATIVGNGDLVYEVSTSNYEDEVVTIDLGEGSYSEVLYSTEGYQYSAVLSAFYNPDDGWSYFRLNCLPAFSYDGNMQSEPLLPEDTIPPTTTTTTQIPVPDATLIST